MINTISDLLNALKNKEQELLKDYDIVKHPGIIGDMYEGLTKEILAQSIFDGLNLSIKAGKIRNAKSEFSGEIDCMIVIGEGENIPYTDKYIYDHKQVIAVIQVKKNLYSKDIKDSYDNLKSVIDIADLEQSEQFHMKILRDTWRLMFKEELPKRDDLSKLGKEKEMIYHVLLLEAYHPARIVWGYNGFKSELKFRESYYNYLGENLSTKDVKKIGFGPLNFPNLIICDNFSLIKSNGIPFVYPVQDDRWWPLYLSVEGNPVYYLLEIIWTRLDYMFKLPSEIFGEDLNIDQMHGFINAIYREKDDMKGWEYMYLPLSSSELKKPAPPVEWEPVFLTKLQFTFLNVLGGQNYFKVTDLDSFLEDENISKEDFIKSLRDTGLFNIGDSQITFITEYCISGIDMKGRFYAADNKTGKVERWLLNQIGK